MPTRTCLHCGTRNFPGNSKCSGCGTVLGAAGTVAPPAPPAPAPVSSWASAFGHVSPPVPYAPASKAPVVHPAVPAPTPGARRWGAPIVEGTVVDTSQIQVSVKPRTGFFRGLLGVLLLVFRPAMVLAAWVLRGRTPAEHQTVLVLRIERDDGGLEQARIESDLDGATMDLGDRVSIWGKRRAGVVIVKYAFNHTVGAEVRLKGRP